MRKSVLRIEKYRHKQLPSFEDKSRANAYAELRFDIGGLVQNQCSTEFDSWKMVPEELKKSMGLDYCEALELFSLNAFRKEQPEEDFLELSEHFLKYARGLPLIHT
ncbi:unnamed protein product [Malus baccata var. baccata]